jgi:hypothetical protein
MADKRRKLAVTKLGNAYGNLMKNLESPKTVGYCLAGSARLYRSQQSREDRRYAPPRTGPIILPALQTKGITLNALA